jgi:hypothetical protein
LNQTNEDKIFSFWPRKVLKKGLPSAHGELLLAPARAADGLRVSASQIADRRMILAGYRLVDLLTRVLGN